MNIMLAFNTNYIDFAAVLIRSLIENETEQLEIHIIHSSLSEEDKLYFTSLTDNCDHIRYHYYKYDNTTFDDMSHASYLSKETYFRLLGLDILPKSMDRILYLDCDIVVNDTISDFYHQDMVNNLLAACPGLGRIPQDVPLETIKANLDITEDIKYCNAGVILFNLSLMREEISTASILKYIDKYKNVLYMADQDIINGFFAGRIKYCDPLKYNYAAKKYVLRKYGHDVANNAVIIHYCLKRKPSSWKYTGTKADIFWKYALLVNNNPFKYHRTANILYRCADYIISPLYKLIYVIYMKHKTRN